MHDELARMGKGIVGYLKVYHGIRLETQDNHKIPRPMVTVGATANIYIIYMLNSLLDAFTM
jgi:hypothetical protein